MVAYYLSRYVGAGTFLDPFRPALDAEGWSAIDLRPDPAQQAGFCLVALPDLAATVPAGSFSIGSGDTVPAAVRTRVGNALGVSLVNATLPELVAELLTDHAGGSRWKPLAPRRVGRMYRWEIQLGGLLWSRDLPVIAGGATITDDFNRANSTNVGANWTEDLLDFSISSNQLTNSGSDDAECRYSGAGLDTNDQYAQSSITNSGGWAAGVYVRHPASTTRTYYCAWIDDTPQKVLIKRVSNSATFLAQISGALGGYPGTVRVEAQGSTVRGLWKGTQFSSVTDTSITSGPQVGIFQYLASKSDDFDAGDIITPAFRPIIRRPLNGLIVR